MEDKPMIELKDVVILKLGDKPNLSGYIYPKDIELTFPKEGKVYIYEKGEVDPKPGRVVGRFFNVRKTEDAVICDMEIHMSPGIQIISAHGKPGDNPVADSIDFVSLAFRDLK